MFVSEEERQSPGGVIGFILPLMVFGAVAGAVMSFQMGQIFSPQPAVQEMGLAVLYTVAVTLALIWRAARPVTSLVMAFSLAGVLLLTTILAPAAIAESVSFGFSIFALLSIARAAVEEPGKAMPTWRALFTAAVTLPVILVLTVLAAGFLGFIVYTLTEILSLNNDRPLFGENGVISGWPAGGVVGALAGLIIAMVRAQRVLIGTVRYALLWLARFALPVVVVIGAVLLLTRTLDYGSPFSPGDSFTPFAMGVMVHLVLALAYQGGGLKPPALWLRVSAWVAIILAPLLYLPRLSGLFFLWRDHAVDLGDVWWQSLVWDLALAGTYSLFAVIGLISGWVIRDRGWMPALAPLSVLWMWLAALGPLIAGLTLLAWRAF